VSETVLITGGAGYIGSHVVRHLHPTFQVVVLDRRPVPPAIASECQAYLGDARDAALLDRLFAEHRVSGVIHIAGDKSVEESFRLPAQYFDNNYGGSLAVLAAMSRAGVGNFIFSSSAAVYGEPDILPITEESPTRPANPYGESKLLVERSLPWFDRCHAIRFVSLRYFNAAGASPDGDIGEDWNRAVNLIPVVMRVAAGRDGAVNVFGSDYETPDGTAIRDYIHVVDLAEAHGAALRHLLGGGGSDIVNLGTGLGASVGEVLDAVRRVSAAPVPAVMSPRRPGDPPAVWADNQRAAQVLGWRPRFGLVDIVETAWRWHSQHSS
jgi:UDP-glucose-4-epimerase GalE